MYCMYVHVTVSQPVCPVLDRASGQCTACLSREGIPHIYRALLQALIRAQALQVLRELIKWEKDRFDNYAELTILNVLQAHKDSNKEVCRSCS